MRQQLRQRPPHLDSDAPRRFPCRVQVARCPCACLLLAIISLLLSRTGQADDVLGPTSPPILLPEAVEQMQGFTMQVEAGRQTEAGYVPFKIRFQSSTVFPADRRFVIRLQSNPQMETPRQNGLVIDVPITVPQGSKSETFIRYLPKWSAGQAISFVLLEEGRPMDGYEAFLGGDVDYRVIQPRFQMRRAPRGSGANRQLLQAEYECNWLFVSAEDVAVPSSLPDLSDLLSPELDQVVRPYTPQLPTNEPGSLAAFWREALSNQRLQAIGQSELPLDWRAYQRYDVVLMERAGLQRLRSQRQAFEAVHGWMLNGGTVLVYDAPSADDVIETFGCKRMEDDKLRDLLSAWAVELRTAWEQRRASSHRLLDELGSPNRAAAANFGDYEQFLAATKQSTSKMMTMLDALPDDPADQIAIQPVGAGHLITLAPTKGLQTPTILHWQLVSRFLDARVSPMLRRGVDPLLGDSRFRNWMIPGVAQPPVYTFMGLLTVFVILVGPVAYRRTTKYGRGYLMFAIAPVLALLTTLAMFAYGILSDGFGTVARIRQLTWVDGPSGHAGERVRSTYFAGVRPAEGLRFDGDVELLPYREGGSQSWSAQDELSPAFLGRVRVEEKAQRLDASFLPSRQQRQFVFHSPRRDVGFLQLVDASQGSEHPEIVSGFDFPIRTAVLRDANSRYWIVDELGPGESKQAQPLVTNQISKTLGRLYNDHRPLSEVRESRSASSRYNNRIFDLILDTNRMLEPRTTMTDGLFESWLQQQLQTSGELPDQHFVATAEVSPDVIAVEGSELVSSIRYVFGTLR